MAQARRWFVELVVAGGRSELHFGTTSMPGGTSLWDSVPWPVDWEPMTEAQILSELHDAVLCLLERRM